jgi:hypothetical protein
MNAFQMIVLPIVAILFIERIVAMVRGRAGRRTAFFWSLLWFLAGVSVAWPGMTKALAAKVGIGRGADLVTYCAVLIMFVGFFMTYTRLRRVEANLTRLVRHIAIQDAIIADAPPASRPPEKPEV